MRFITPLCISLCLSLATAACVDDGSSVGESSAASGEGMDSGAREGWRDLAPIAVGPRQEHSVVALDGKVYVIAGLDADQRNTGRVEVYDPRAGTWSEAAPLPLGLNHANVAAVNGKIYLLGGMIGDFPWMAIGDAFEYDPATDAWTALDPMPEGTARGSAAVGTKGTKIYLAGGLRSLSSPFQDTVPTFSSYDVATGAWEALPDLPEPRDHVAGAVVGSTFYVLGGRANGQDNVADTVFAYDLAEGAWSTRAPMPTARGGVATAVIGETIYVIGGEGNQEPGTSGIFDDNEAYDTARDAWEVLAPMRTPRHGTGAAAVGATIYVPGGGTQQGFGATDVADAFRP
ncbi:kelch repeat-containing protein [Sorangium sp. So ce1036]|uniref:Kelch repeat-containing protein n=1 Tax=Sorangium sp. So ce1036 TaxID=3133328 RepID=UPI003F0D4A3E